LSEKNGKLYQEIKNKTIPKNMKKPKQNMLLSFNNTNKYILNMIKNKRKIKRNKRTTRATLKRQPTKFPLAMRILKKIKLNQLKNPILMKIVWEVYDVCCQNNY
jgi:hypothetical protein